MLALLASQRDIEITRRVLGRAGMHILPCRDLAALCEELAAGASAVLLFEEALAGQESGPLLAWLARQPAWSDLPILVTSRHGADSPVIAQAMQHLGNVTVLERPMRVATLVSAARAALRARERQYQVRDQMVERERADARKDEFLAMLGHELRNPLAPIANSLALLTRQPDRPPPAQVIQVMSRQVGHMVRLIDDLLDLSRITRGAIDLERERLDMREVILQAVDNSRPAIERARHRLHLDLPEEALPLSGDSVRLVQVLDNLLTNAAKYTEPGGDIWVRARRKDDMCEVSVRDTGVGLTQPMLTEVFELFRQMQHTAPRAAGGLGIGLTLVRRLVELHGGTTWAASPGLGLGSTFHLRLPLVWFNETGSESRQRSSIRESMPSGTPTQRVLIVDDNRDAADSLAQLLLLWDMTVRVEYGGAAALEALDAFQPTAVLLDLGLPDIDGYAVAARIRRHPVHGQVRLIALSGWGQDADRARTQSVGFDHHLVKPADAELLLTALAPADEQSSDGIGISGNP